MSSPTLTDVARRANVALSTASRAFSDPDRLGPDTLRKILSIAQELGYTPAVKDAEPVTPRTATIAVVVPDIANPVFSSFVKAVQGQGWQDRHTVVLADSDFDPEREREVIRTLAGRVDGIVVCSSRLDADEVLGLCGRLPVVLVNREAAGADCIVADATQGLRETIDYLTALGHRRIAYVQGSPRSWSNAHRVEVVRALAAERDLDLEMLDWQTETVSGGTAAAARVVASGATAVIAHNDLVALGVMSGARALGVRVPTDLSVVGMDDIPFGQVVDPPLSSIDVPMGRAGRLSIEVLGRALAGEARTPRTQRLDTHLVVRGSTGPLTQPKTGVRS
ncbi:LacI family DNA-binding transcriptional regulator [Pseudonocardia sp. NPDC049154]|uniref:LacI family DNA-binding transcriptional regulator n=1 Tax=Pseudonocardia sp. NPDC049154 TaxID=3155501 RepID=UPI0033E84D4C